MRRAIHATILIVFLTGLAAGQEKQVEEVPTLASLTHQAAALQEDIRRSRNPDARQRLLQRLELVYHQMGPTDAAGDRIHCQAMWHDRTLERLEQEMKRMVGRDLPLAEAHGTALVRHGRLAVRRMARACLTHGWRLYDGPEKYQVDAFGQYLANNMETLDRLIHRLSGLTVPSEAAPAGAAAGAPAETGPAGAPAESGVVDDDAPATAPDEPPATAPDEPPAAAPAEPPASATPAAAGAEAAETIDPAADDAAGPAEAGSADAAPAEKGATVAQPPKVEDLSPLGRARRGLAAMEEAADALAAMPSDPPEALLAPLGAFMEGLVAVREAAEGVAAPAESPDEEGQPAESPSMTEAEAARLAAVREAAAALAKMGEEGDESEGPSWAGVARYLERFAAMIEAGFTVASARPKARELLEQTDRAARLARDIAASPLIDDALRTERGDDLLKALTQVGRPVYRASGYALLDRLERLDGFRRRVQALGVSLEVGRGLVRAHDQVAPKWRNSTSADAVRGGTTMLSTSAGIVRTLERMGGWPPENMAPSLRTCYDRQQTLFLREAETAGARAAEDPREALPMLRAASRRGSDLALIVRAETVVQAIKRYRPRQAGSMYQHVLQASQALVVSPDEAERSRSRLDGLIRPFEALERFPAPDPARQRTLTRLIGQAYGAAVTKLSRDIGAGINLAADGDPMALRVAMRADALFRLARKRALAEEGRLQQADVTNLSAFSMPAEVWASFHTGLDRRLKALFAVYVRGGRDRDWYAEPPALEAVFGPVSGAQRLTLDARFPGEAPLNFLMRNLHRVAVPDAADRARDGWAVGYHVTEAAAAALGDFDVVADWHRRRLRPYRGRLDRVDLSVPKGEADAR